MQPPNDPELMSLVELQKFLTDELASTDPASSFSRAFLPLTDGLGLESPKRPLFTPEKKEDKKEEKKPAVEIPPPPPIETKRPEPSVIENKVTYPAKEIAPIIAPPEDELPPVDTLLQKKKMPIFREPEVTAIPQIVSTPPPMPHAGFFRRLQSAAMDQAFVLALWALALFITSLAMGGKGLLSNFANAVFLRYALIEFVAIWVCYATFCFGLLGMSFGMWTWGLRLNYGERFRWAKKLSRIVFSLLFLAPIAPSLLLAIRVRGRNLLDLLSGTAVYRTTA